jgi:hypothetical protein
MGHMVSDKPKIEKKLTNRELLSFRRNARVKDLALFEEHERTHTGTAVLRKARETGQYENALDAPLVAPQSPTRPANAEEILSMVLHTLLLAGKENIPMADACRRIAARFGLAHNQVHSLRLEVHSYLKRIVNEVKFTFPGDVD